MGLKTAEYEVGQALLVTTEHRGVFFGRFASLDGTTIRLTECRNCLYWPREQKGFIGLAAYGPVDGSRVGPAADLTLYGVTSIAVVTPEAAEKWEAAPWS